MKRLLLILALAAGHIASAHAQSVIPPDLERLQTAYEAARERATRPLDEKYLAELVKLQASYTRAAKLDEALAVANEIKGIKERLGLAAKSKSAAQGTPTPATPTKPAGAPPGGQETTITISANDPNAYRIGAVKKGDTITLAYVSGKWKSKGGIATESPDDPKATYKDDDRVVIAEPATESGAAGKVIAIVPPETSLKSFTYLVQTSRPEVVLRINTNSERKENPGTVTYKLTLNH